MAQYPTWKETIEKYSKAYGDYFQYRDSGDKEELEEWLKDADTIFYHYGEKDIVESLIHQRQNDTQKGKYRYVVFSGGDTIGSQQELHKHFISELGIHIYSIGREGLNKKFVQAIEKAKTANNQ